MLDLFERVVNDETVKRLIERARGVKGSYPRGCVYVIGARKNQPKLLLPTVYCDQEDFENQFTEQEKDKYNGRILIHTIGLWNYKCIADIADGAGDKKIGRWVIAGYGPEKKANEKRDEILKEFRNERHLIKRQEETMKKINEMALLHQYGTNEYTLIETGLMPEFIEDLETL